MKKSYLLFYRLCYLPLCTQCVPNTTFTGVLGLDAEAILVSESGDSLTALPHANVEMRMQLFLTLECLQTL